MKTKRFDKKLFKENDNKAKKIVSYFFQSRGYKVIENPNKFGIDLQIFNNNKLAYLCECEIKKGWKTYKFPYSTVQFPERKKKFMKKTGVIFSMINEPSTRMLIVKAKDILNSPLCEVPNKYITSGENFFQVALEKVNFLSLKGE